VDYLLDKKFTVLGKELTRWPKEHELKMGRKLVEREGEWGQYIYLWYLEGFLQETVAITEYKKAKYNTLTRQIATVSDEAVTKLLIENHYRGWMKMAKWE
jgi:hypothetical protein